MVRINPVSITIDFFSEIATSLAHLAAAIPGGNPTFFSNRGINKPDPPQTSKTYVVRLSAGVALPASVTRPTPHTYAEEITVAGIAIALFAKNPWVRLAGFLTGTSTLTGCADAASTSSSPTDYSSLLTEEETRQVNASLPA